MTSLQNPTGYTSGRAYTVTTLDTQFAPIVQAWSTARSVTYNQSGCASDGVCSGTLEAAGLAISCNASTAEFDLLSTNSDGSMSDDSFSGLDVFQVTLGWSAITPANITLNLQYKPENGDECGKGQLQVRNCTIGAATVQYPVTIDGNKSTVALSPQSTFSDDKVLSLTTMPMESGFGMPSPLGGFAYALSSKLNSATRMRFAGAAGYEMTSTGSLTAQFADMSDVQDYGTGLCKTKFTDPSSYIFAQARDLMFRTSLAQGNSSSSSSSSSSLQPLLSATELRTVTVYESHFEYLAIAVALTFIAMGIVLATFNGFWLLGRNVTMSPIETAKAFNAPLLAAEHPNAEVRELVKGAGRKPVRYGEVMISSSASASDERSMYKGGMGHGDSRGGGTDTVELRSFQVGFEDPANVQPLGGKRRR